MLTGPKKTILVLDKAKQAVVRLKMSYPSDIEILADKLPDPRCFSCYGDYVYVGCSRKIRWVPF